MTKMTIEFVDRPAPDPHDVRYALLETARNQKAVILPLHGRPVRRMQNSLRAWLLKRGHVLHYKVSFDQQSLIAWADRKKRTRR
jgi:hypothetical protein